MWMDLSAGTLVISITVFTQIFGLVVLSRGMPHFMRWGRLHRHGFGRTVAMVATVFGLFLVHTVEIWTWAGAYLVLGTLPDFPDALYFSAVTFSTLGYGDIILAPEWRLFGALEGVSGLLLIGWSTAYLVSASTRYGPFRIGEHF
jgi:Ion channel